MAAGAKLEDFKRHLNIQSVDDDDELTEFLAAATIVAEQDPDCGAGPIIQRTITARVTAEQGMAVLPVSPAVSLTSWVGVLGARDYDVSGLDLDVDTSVVRAVAGRLASGEYQVTYTAGHAASVDDVPANISRAVCIIGKHLWETQRGRGTGTRGGALASQSSLPDERVPAGFLVPHRARSLLLGSRPWVAVG